MTIAFRTETGGGPGGRDAFARWHPPGIVAAALLAALAAPWLWALPAEAVAVGATALVLVGVPHGAVDHRVARPLLRPRLGRLWWFPAFAGLYLGAAALILAGWLVAPALSLALFLLVSVAHFGTEDAEGRGALARIARGGAPVALPILLHPERTERFFAVLGGEAHGFAILHALAWAWLPLALLFALRLARRREGRAELVELGAIVLAFALLPPLAGFAFYFLAVHSPRHMAELARRHAADAPGRGWAWAARRSLPLSLATFALGVTGYLALAGTAEERLLRATFWGLAALTVPHMALHHIDRRWGGAPLT